MATFGKTTVGASTTSVEAGYKLLSPYSLAETGLVQSISWYGRLDAQGDVRLGIYADNAGAPGALLGYTGAIAVGTTDAWQTGSLTNAPLLLAAGNYWLAWHSDQISYYYYDTGTGGSNADAFADGLSDPAGTIDSTGRAYSIYATYDLPTSVAPPADTLTVSDQLSSVTAALSPLSDTLALAEEVTAGQLVAPAADAVALSDQLTDITADATPGSDSLSLADTPPAVQATLAPLADVTGWSDAVSATVGVSMADTLAVSDQSPGITAQISRSVETLVVSDLAAVEKHIPPPQREVRILDYSGAFVGVLPARVRWTQKLLGPHVLESVEIPAEYLRQDGTRENRLAYIDQGWQVLFEGGRYIIEDVDSDEETGLTFRARSAEAAELSNYQTNYSPGPATYLNKTPTAIMQALLAGKIGRRLRNPGFGVLDSSKLPTNWSHPAGWTSALVGNRRVWQADAGSDESVSDQIRCALGERYRVAVDVNAPVGMAGTAGVLIRWQKADGSMVDSAVTNVTPTGSFATIETGDLTAQGDRCYIVLRTAGTNQVVQFDDVRLFEMGPDTGWTYAGSMDTRDAAIPHTDGGIVRYGVWTNSGVSLDATTPGDYLARVVNGPFVTVNWAAGGAGATCLVRINGVRYQQSGSALVPGSSPIDVSGALSLTASGLDPANDHIVEVEVVSTATRFTGLTVSSVALISMRWDFKTVLEALDSVVKAVGGELSFDTVNRVITHAPTVGRDLRAENIVLFRRGTNIVRLGRSGDRRGIVNRCTGLGYGEGEYQLVVTVDATGTDESGQTSQALYGTQRGYYENKDAKDPATFLLEVQQAVEASAFEKTDYQVEVTDEAAALCSPGDVGRFLYKTRDLALRILEIKRDNLGGKATLTVGTRADTAADVIRGVRRQLATLQRSYQGVPADSNDSFSEQFDRTAGGVDHPAEVPFYVPYGADLLDLRLRYQVGGMRNFATGAASGGGSTSSSETTPSGGGATSGAGGAAVPTSSSVATPSGGGSTSGSTVPAAQRVTSRESVMASRYLNTLGAWYTVGVKTPAGASAHDVFGYIYNHDSASQTFTYQFRRDSHTGTIVYGPYTVAVPAGECAAVSPDAASTPAVGAQIFFQVELTSGTADAYISAGVNEHYDHDHGTHSHSTPDHTHPAHAHTVTLSDHTHSTPDHTHPAHAHTVGNHTHALAYGIYESATPATVRVYLDGSLIAALSDQTIVSDFDLLPYIGKDSNGRVAEGWHTLEFRTATNGATGSVRGALFARKFLATEAA